MIRAGFGMYYNDLAQNGWVTAFQAVNRASGALRQADAIRVPARRGERRRGCDHRSRLQDSLRDSRQRRRGACVQFPLDAERRLDA